MEEQFLESFIQKFQGEDELLTKFYEGLRTGNNQVFHNIVAEHFMLDDNWIFTIEGALYSIETISRNPRRFIKEIAETVAIEKAKRINSRSVQHLASHSQFVESIEKDNVRPKKILVSEIEEDIAIYENRFVYALIERVDQFVEKRYVEIGDKAKNIDTTNLNMRSEFKMGRNEFECSFDIKVKEPTHDKEAEARMNELLGKIENIRKRLRILKNGDFCKELSKAKPVKPPIQKTNLLRMNVDYRNCYNLWLFVSAYNTLGYSLEVTEKTLPVDGDYFDDLTMVTTLAVQSLVTDGNLKRSRYDKIPITKRREHDYKVVTNYKYVPDFGTDKTKNQGEDAVNEYYFRQMRNELVRAVRRNQIEEEKQLDLNFQHFYRSIAKINGEMYKDIIKSEYEKQPKGKSVIQKKECSVGNQKVLLKRYHQLAKLMKQELEKTLKLEKRELLKLEKLQKDLAKAKQQRIDTIEKNKKKKLKEIEKQTRLAQQNADAYERELRGLEAAKAVQKEEEKLARREEAKRARELKKYQELKEKFDGENE